MRETLYIAIFLQKVLVLQSKKIKMDYVGPLYVYSKFDKFQFVLSTIDGEVIEQLFNVARLKKVLLRLPNGKTASNIKDYLKIKSELQNELHKTATTNSGRSSADKAEPRPSTSSMIHTEDANRSLVWYKGPQAVYLSNMEANARTSQQCQFSSIASLEAKPNIKPVLLYENKSDIEEVCYITKSRYKLGVLEVYTHVN